MRPPVSSATSVFRCRGFLSFPPRLLLRKSSVKWANSGWEARGQGRDQSTLSLSFPKGIVKVILSLEHLAQRRICFEDRNSMS